MELPEFVTRADQARNNKFTDHSKGINTSFHLRGAITRQLLRDRRESRPRGERELPMAMSHVWGKMGGATEKLKMEAHANMRMGLAGPKPICSLL